MLFYWIHGSNVHTFEADETIDAIKAIRLWAGERRPPGFLIDQHGTKITLHSPRYELSLMRSDGKFSQDLLLHRGDDPGDLREMARNLRATAFVCGCNFADQHITFVLNDTESDDGAGKNVDIGPEGNENL